MHPHKSSQAQVQVGKQTLHVLESNDAHTCTLRTHCHPTTDEQYCYNNMAGSMHVCPCACARAVHVEQCTVQVAQCTVHVAQCTVHVAQCTVQVAQCTVHVAQCTVQVAQCTVHVAQCTVHVAQCTVHVAQCTVHVAQCTVHVAQCTVHVAQCTVHVAQCTVHVAQCTVHVAQCTVHVAQCTVHVAQCTVHVAQCTVHVAQCTVQVAQCTVHVCVKHTSLPKNAHTEYTMTSLHVRYAISKYDGKHIRLASDSPVCLVRRLPNGSPEGRSHDLSHGTSDPRSACCQWQPSRGRERRTPGCPQCSPSGL